MFNQVSTNGTSNIWVQIGDSGGVETSSYESVGTLLGPGPAISATHETSAFLVHQPSLAANTHTGRVVLELESDSAFTWVGSGIMERSGGAMTLMAGTKSTSAQLDRVRITMANGTDTFDAGEISVSYE